MMLKISEIFLIWVISCAVDGYIVEFYHHGSLYDKVFSSDYVRNGCENIYPYLFTDIMKDLPVTTVKTEICLIFYERGYCEGRGYRLEGGLHRNLAVFKDNKVVSYKPCGENGEIRDKNYYNWFSNYRAIEIKYFNDGFKVLRKSQDFVEDECNRLETRWTEDIKTVKTPICLALFEDQNCRHFWTNLQAGFHYLPKDRWYSHDNKRFSFKRCGEQDEEGSVTPLIISAKRYNYLDSLAPVEEQRMQKYVELNKMEFILERYS